MSTVNRNGASAQEEQPQAQQRGHGHPSRQRPLLLSAPEDPRWLTDLVCLMRSQIEVFAATAADEELRSRRGGLKKPILPGRVGLRCVHCAHLPPGERAKGAVSYPNSMSLVNQAVRNWQRHHFLECPEIPRDVVEKYYEYKPTSRLIKGTSSVEYWIESCKSIGLRDTDPEDGGGMRFEDDEYFQKKKVRKEEGEGEEAAPDAALSAPSALDGGIEKEAGGAVDDRVSSDNDYDQKPSSVHVGKTHTGSITPPLSHTAAALDGLNDNMHGLILGADLHTDESGFAPLVDFDADSGSFAAEQKLLPLDATDATNLPSPLEAKSMQTGPEGLDLDYKDESTIIAPASDTMPSVPPLPLPTASCSLPSERRDQRQDARLVERVRLAYDIVKMSQDIRLLPPEERGADGSPHGAGGGTGEGSTDDDKSGLYYLGVELYKLFAARHPFDNETHDDASVANVAISAAANVSGGGSDSPAGGSAGDSPSGITKPHNRDDAKSGPKQSCSDKRPKGNNAAVGYTPLRELGLPASVCSLVSSLLDVGKGNPDKEADNGNIISKGEQLQCYYNSMDEVKRDLHLMTLDPDRFLFDDDIQTLQGGLTFPRGRLYGRDAQMTELMDAYNRVVGTGGPCEVVLVSGYSGTGKSSLVQQVRWPLTVMGGYFLSGKFDELRQVRPYSAIVGAFNDFCDMLIEGSPEVLSQMRSAIKDAVGSDGRVLTDFIPNLCKVIGEQPECSTATVEGRGALNRLMFFLRKFLRTISSRVHPVILFFDDLQWADEASLQLIRTLVTDPDMKSFLFLGCYRDNEVVADHPLTVLLRHIEESKVGTTAINIDNLDRKSVNELISDTLHLSPYRTQPLTELVYNKTSGNALFVVQFLKSLYDEGLLRFSLESRCWEWDGQAIQSKEIADNVVELMMSKLLKLAPEVRVWLKIAACLGCQSDESTFKLLAVEDEAQGLLHLDVAVREGLMYKVGSVYRFSHDQIQHAAYSLIDNDNREALHYEIGTMIWKRVSNEELDGVIFVLVDQLRRGSSLIKDHDEKVSVAGLCLMAGKKAISSSMFVPASIYLHQGIELLGESDWESQYSLCLELFSCCVETQYVIGDFERLQSLANSIFANGKSFQDKLRAYKSSVNALGAQGKPLDAIGSGLHVLAQLGEVFPTDGLEEATNSDFGRTIAMLHGTSVDSILHSSEIQDWRKVAAMQFLNQMAFHAYFAKQGLLPLIVFRMVQISLIYGVCKESSYAFATLGMMLCRSVDGIEQGYCYGKLALSLLDRFNAKECLARVYAVVYNAINSLVEPLQANLEAHRHAYKVGMSVGDIEWALTNASVCFITAVQCGYKLDLLADEAREYRSLMIEHNHHLILEADLLPCLQAILNLTGNSEDPTVLTGEAMNQDDALNKAAEINSVPFVATMTCMRMWLAYLFGRYDVAAEMARRRRDLTLAQTVRNLRVVNEVFYIGLIGAAVALSGDEQSEWVPVVYDAREKIAAWAAKSRWNYQHKLEFLNAEIARLSGDTEGATKAYDDAIRIAGEHSFVHEQALACERAGMFHSRASNSQVAISYFTRSHQYYLQWGATRKADDLLQHLERVERSLGD